MRCNLSEKGGKEDSAASSAEMNGKVFTDSDYSLGHRSSHLLVFPLLSFVSSQVCPWRLW